MSETTGIQWTDATFNPWLGCMKVSEECKHCYADTQAKAFDMGKGLPLWGPGSHRRMLSEGNWQKPELWNRKAQKAGTRTRVFCASMADVFEDRPELVAPRDRLLRLMEQTPNLDWQILTKRPENMIRLGWPDEWPRNVWAGTSVGVRATLDRLDHVRAVPAAVRFLSCEPLLEDLGDVNLAGIDWVIIGGESGSGARLMLPEWGMDLAERARAAGAKVFWKQLGTEAARYVGLRDPGDDPSEWLPEMRVREFPASAAI